MDIAQTLGNLVTWEVRRDPRRARALLLAGWRTQQAHLHIAPDGKLPRSRQFIAALTMDSVIRALTRPQRAAAVSLFMPSEPLVAAGLAPYSVETLSAFLSGTKCEGTFLGITADEGLPETMCSYHRTFTGAMDCGLVPAPAFTAFTNLACDGNMLTFPRLRERFGIPAYFIDVPYAKDEDAVRDVADQIRGYVAFIEEVTGMPVPEDKLRAAVARGIRTGYDFMHATGLQRTRRLPSDMTSEMYAVFTNHILLGSREAERYACLLRRDMEAAPESDAVRLVWLHLIPNMQPAVNAALNLNERVFVTGLDLAWDPFLMEADADRPYETMARRMVQSAYNGRIDERTKRALEMADRTGASGAVLFAQWGCKATLGAANLMKRRLEEAGLPCLVLDSDGCDRSNASDGQTATRLNAFLEMLEAGHGR